MLVEYGDAIDPAVNEKVRAMAALLKQGLPDGVEAVIPAYRNLSLIYDPLVTSPEKTPFISCRGWKHGFTRSRSRRPGSSRSPSCTAASSAPTSRSWRSTTA